MPLLAWLYALQLLQMSSTSLSHSPTPPYAPASILSAMRVRSAGGGAARASCVCVKREGEGGPCAQSRGGPAGLLLQRTHGHWALARVVWDGL